MNLEIPKKAGLYIVSLKNDDPISVNANDPRIADKAIKVTKANCKFGKAKNLAQRKKNYDKVFGETNVSFKPLVLMSEIKEAEKSVLQMLNQHRIRGRTGRKNEWLEKISPNEVKQIVFLTLDLRSFAYMGLDKYGQLDYSLMRDSEGTPFSFESHVLNNDGAPVFNKDGSFRNRPREPIDEVMQ